MSKRLDETEIRKAIEAAASAEGSENPAIRRALQLDIGKYQAFLDDANLSEAQKSEMIEALWSIIVAFVEIGYGVHPVQEACEASEKDEIALGNAESDGLYSGELSTNKAESARRHEAPEPTME